ncbi:MAG: serine hydrolase [Acidobacteriota bacterium]
MRTFSTFALIASTSLSVLTAAAAVAEPQAELTADDLRVFLDEFFERELAAEQVVGAGVAVLRDGEIVASRGYGFADREQELPVVAETTLFPAQSVSKLFAATAVMQLYERGLVDLDADVRNYLADVSIDSDFAQPVTLGHLLTHTAGFDDSYIGMLPRDPDDILTVPDFLNRYRRRVVFAPGTVHAYSNYGSLLARHVVEVVTGKSYEDYLVEEIIRPLGMQQSCVLPPPPEWVDRFATGYMPSRDGVESTRDMFPDGLVRFRTHTGTLATTVVDMARFMIAHLEGGGIDGSRILEPGTVRLMHRQQFAQHPRLPGVAYGFFESAAAGQRGLFHFGSGFGYSTLLYLLPDQHTGFYIAHSNNSSSRDARILRRRCHSLRRLLCTGPSARDDLRNAPHDAGAGTPPSPGCRDSRQ